MSAFITTIRRKFGKTMKPYITGLLDMYKVSRGDLSYYEQFEYWQKNGFTIIPNHFYQPIPDLASLSDSVFRQGSLLGINLQEKEQLQLLTEAFAKYSNECSDIPTRYTGVEHEYHFNNIAFDWLDG